MLNEARIVLQEATTAPETIRAHAAASAALAGATAFVTANAQTYSQNVITEFMNAGIAKLPESDVVTRSCTRVTALRHPRSGSSSLTTTIARAASAARERTASCSSPREPPASRSKKRGNSSTSPTGRQ